MRTWLLFAMIFLLVTTAVAAEGHSVTYQSGNETVHGVFFLPKGQGPFPALVAIHEWWGLNDWVKQQASNLSHQGYAVLTIDLYRGKVATTPEQAHEIMRGVPEDRALRDLQAATAYLHTLTTVDSKRIGAIGWCMGGGYALDLAVADPKLRVVVINYGHLATDDATLKKIHANVLGIFGGQDQGITVADVQKFQEQMKALDKKVEIHVFPDAGHAFENQNNQKGYRPEDATQAWKYTVDFLQKNLKY
ncbi:MAG: dienelactone hydrolase family protein [Candidatus Korobacteraceae bacterium]